MSTSNIIDIIDPYNELKKSAKGRIFTRFKNSSDEFDRINFNIHDSRITREQAKYSSKSQSSESTILESSALKKLDELKSMSDDEKIEALMEINNYQNNEERFDLRIGFLHAISSLFISEILDARVKLKNVDENNIFNDEFDYVYTSDEIIYLLLCEIFLFSLKEDIFGEENFRKYIDKAFIAKLLEHLQTDDTNKRNLLKQILYQIYAKMFKFRPVIFTKMQEMLLRICEKEIDSCLGISEILEIISRAMEYFSSPLRIDEFRFLEHVILPLHFLPLYPLYASKLIQCLKILIYKENPCSYLEYFLKEIEEILMVCSKEDVMPLMLRLFTIFRMTLKSLNTYVLDAVIDVLNNDFIMEIIETEPSVYLPFIYIYISRIQDTHWSNEIQFRALALTKRLSYLNPEKYKWVKKKKATNI